MRYLVTGGAGFIGSHLVERLVAQGKDVVVLDDFSTGRRENLDGVKGRFRLIEASVLDSAACARAVRDADIVLHQAALGSVLQSMAEPIAVHETNVTGTLNLLIAARQAGVRRLVYAGSSAAYGHSDLPNREDAFPLPRSPYGASKLAGEVYCATFWRSFGFETVTLRYFNVFGPRQESVSQYASIVPKLIAAALTRRQPTINGDGQQTRDFVYVSDIVDACMKACEAPPDIAGETLNVGTGRQISLNDLWTLIASLADFQSPMRHVGTRPADVAHSGASISKTQSLLGFAAVIPLIDGLERTINWYRTHASSLG